MAIAQRGTATHTGNTTGSLSIAKPTGVVSGDVMILFVTENNQTVTATGWTLHAATVETTNNVYKFSIYYKVAGGSEPSSYTVSNPGGAPILGTIIAFSGVDTAAPMTGAHTAFATNQTEPLTTPTATSSVATGRVLYARSARNIDSGGPPAPTPLIYSTAAGGVSELEDFGQQGSGTVSYSHAIYAATSDFTSSGNKTGIGITAAGTFTDTYQVVSTIVLKAAPEGNIDGMTLGNVSMAFAGDHRISADLAMTLGPLTMDFAGNQVIDADGTIGMTLGNVGMAFAGDSTGGPLAMTLQPISIDLAGQLIYGSIGVTLNPVTIAVDAAVNPLGPLAMTLNPITMEFTTETVPFGEHVIHVEPEARAFLVIDDDPGLKDIKRSQVTDL